jgi:hypothetical protein
MKAVFHQGNRYRVVLRVPEFVQPSAVIALLRNKLSDVVLGKPARGQLTVEATWKAEAESYDSDFIVSYQRI